MFHLSDLFHKKHHDEHHDEHHEKPDEVREQKVNEDEYTNIVTADGKRLKKIPGGWTLHGTGGDLYEDDIIGV